MTKSPNALRTISEASEAVGLPAHVLRFWEDRLSFIKPVKSTGGRRFYRPRDLQVLKAVRRLHHEQKLSLDRVQALYRREGLAPFLTQGAEGERLQVALNRLAAAKTRLDALL